MATSLLPQVYEHFGKKDPPPASLGKTREWNVDIVPKFLMASGKCSLTVTPPPIPPQKKKTFYLMHVSVVKLFIIVIQCELYNKFVTSFTRKGNCLLIVLITYYMVQYLGIMCA